MRLNGYMVKDPTGYPIAIFLHSDNPKVGDSKEMSKGTAESYASGIRDALAESSGVTSDKVGPLEVSLVAIMVLP